MDDRLPLPMTFQSHGTPRTGQVCPRGLGTPPSLSGSGAINPVELEHIIERALMQIDGRIALEDLRGMLEGSGLEDTGGAADNQTVH